MKTLQEDLFDTVEWRETDVDQYGRSVSNTLYQFKQKSPFYEGNVGDEEEWIIKTIDLEKYTYRQIEDACSSYYKSMGELFEIYGEDSEWIIAECIFEQSL